MPGAWQLSPFSVTFALAMAIKQQRSNREISNANLIPHFKPGQSGNPNGRPKSSVTMLLKNTAAQTTRQIAKQLTKQAVDGDLKAIDMFIDRTDGKVIQGTDLTFNGEGLAEVLLKLRGYNPQLKEGEDAAE